jgi:hypothetical protein
VTAYQTSVPASAAYTSTASLSAYFPYATTLATTISSPLSAAGAQSAATYSAAPAPADQTSSSGPGTGEIVGRVVGAIVVVLTFAIVAFLYWHRTRKQPSALRQEITTTVLKFGENNWRPDFDKEVKPMTTTNVVFTTELSAEQAIYAASYEKKPLVPEVLGDPPDPSQQLSPMQPNSVHCCNDVCAFCIFSMG